MGAGLAEVPRPGQGAARSKMGHDASRRLLRKVMVTQGIGSLSLEHEPVPLRVGVTYTPQQP